MRISDWSSDVCSSDLRSTVPVTAEQFASLFPLRQTRRRAATARSAVAPEASGPITSSERCRSRVIPKTRKRSEEHTSELQSLMHISYAVFCLKKKKKTKQNNNVIRQITTHKNDNNNRTTEY